MSGLWVTASTIAIIGLSAFFVAVEFSLIAAKRNRLEDAATSSRAARAALRSATELSVLLAGAQLGITICTLALGAITKPAVHHALTPLVASTGLPPAVGEAASFVLALLLVTFLHLVVGEMAPKSWAIAHPERSAILLALPMRGFMWLARPLLQVLNVAANALVRRCGAEPVDELNLGADPDSLRQLVEHSASVGALDARYLAPIGSALDLRHVTVGDLVGDCAVTSVPRSATIADVQQATRASGHLRVLLGWGRQLGGVVHVRDTLTHTDLSQPAAELARPALTLPTTTPLHEALAVMRETRNQLGVVVQNEKPLGVITLADILPRLLPAESPPAP